MAIDFNPEGKKTILTVDGGGSRGILPLMMLKRLEEETDKPCHELFDFVSGTSVGAIIAGFIASGRSATELLDIFERLATLFFTRNYFDFVFRRGLRALYDKQLMREQLQHYLGDMTLGELEVALLVTTKDMARSETIFFVNSGPGAKEMTRVRLADAVEASMSAPVYFEPLGDAVDGGVGTFGNTCYVATVEAMVYMSREDPDWRDGNVLHLSFGTGASLNATPRGEVRHWLPHRWPLWVLGEMAEEASENNVRFTLRHYRDRIDFRRYQVSLADSIVRDELGVTIPPGVHSNGLPLDTSRPAEVQLMKDIGAAYAEGIDFTLPGEALYQNPPPGSGGAFYPSRLPDLTYDVIQAMFQGKAL